MHGDVVQAEDFTSAKPDNEAFHLLLMDGEVTRLDGKHVIAKERKRERDKERDGKHDKCYTAMKVSK